MSYHAVENLVEGSVYLVENAGLSKQEKRNLFFNLYRLQNLFDTSYTVLRCFSILANNNFIQKLPIEEHPDFRKHKKYFSAFGFEENNWFPANVIEPEDRLWSKYVKPLNFNPRV